MAKSRFARHDVLEALCRDFTLALSQDVTKGLFEPKYLKIFLERLIALDFHKNTVTMVEDEDGVIGAN